MHHYPHHIADFNNATRHLSRIERSVYRDLLDLYYDTEAPLTKDFDYLCRRIIATDEQERTAVQRVLNEYFTDGEQGWENARCDIEIRAYRGLIEAKKKAGRASACARSIRANQGVATPVEQQSTGVQQTKNQEPRTKNQKPTSSLRSEGVQGECASGSDSLPSAAPPAAPEKSARGSRLPIDWLLPKAWGEWALTDQPTWDAVKVRLEAEKFRDHWFANANQASGKKADWLAAWRSWVRKEGPVRFNGHAPPRRASAHQLPPPGSYGESRRPPGYEPPPEDPNDPVF